MYPALRQNHFLQNAEASILFSYGMQDGDDNPGAD
jgi:hypothetical protein